MKGNLVIIGVMAALLAIVTSFTDATEKGISLQEAQQLSKETGKPILIDFYTTWCPPCKAFDRERSSDAEIKQALEEVILVKINAEKGDGVELAKAYWVDRYPTYVVVKPDGNVQDQWTGYRKFSFLAKLRDVMTQIKETKG